MTKMPAAAAAAAAAADFALFAAALVAAAADMATPAGSTATASAPHHTTAASATTKVTPTEPHSSATLPEVYSIRCSLGWCSFRRSPRPRAPYTRSHSRSQTRCTSFMNPSKSPANALELTTSEYPTGTSTPHEALARFWLSTCSLSCAMITCRSSARVCAYFSSPRFSGRLPGLMLRVPSGYTTKPLKSLYATAWSSSSLLSCSWPPLWRLKANMAPMEMAGRANSGNTYTTRYRLRMNARPSVR
mmetsp:Transcript_29199/g.72222  ORF Transcript_29199/g.72222 Transcript_29199/m.72222 type:complete len:246 (-) Transcript_29199:273-1010(-)